jgi:Lrp/AsnC family leucine-responsive transcriptional regulator
MAMKPLDELDRRILDALQRDGRATLTELGRTLGLSQPAMSERVRRLERRGAVTGYRAEVDPAALGVGLQAVLRVRTTAALLPDAVARIEGMAEVIDALRVTGEDCLVLRVAVPDALHLEAVVDAFTRFGPVTTSIILRELGRKPVPTQGPS